MNTTFEKLDDLLAAGENQEATETFLSLSQEEQEEYIIHRYETFQDFSFVDDWDNGRPPTLSEVRKDLLYLIESGKQ